MLEVYREIQRRRERGETVVLATVVQVKGSTPRQPGAKMAIAADGSIVGTIGGGIGEKVVMEQAPEIIRSGKPRLVYLNLTSEGAANLGAVCGGTMEIFLEPVEPIGRQ